MLKSEISSNFKKKQNKKKINLKKHIFDVTEKLLLNTVKPWHARVDFWIEIINNTPERTKLIGRKKNTY